MKTVHFRQIVASIVLTLLVSACAPQVNEMEDTSESSSSTTSLSSEKTAAALAISIKNSPGVIKRGENIQFDVSLGESAANTLESLVLEYAVNGTEFKRVAKLALSSTQVQYTIPSHFLSTRTGKFRIAGSTLDGDTVYSEPTDAISIATQTETLTGSLTNHGVSFANVAQVRMGAPLALIKIGNNLFFGTGAIIGKLDLTDAQNPVYSVVAGTVTSTGSADGFGAAAGINGPRAFATDGTYLYFPEASNHIVRRLNLSTNEVKTIAGLAGSSGDADGVGSSARFNSPRGLALHGSTLYVVDSNRVRKLVYDSGLDTYTVSTLVGSSSGGFVNANGTSARFSTPNYVAVSSDGNKLYVADSGNRVIREINTNSPFAVTTLAGGNVSTVTSTTLQGVSGLKDGVGTNAQFYNPYAVSIEGDSLFVADWNCTIRKIFVGSTGGTYGEVSTIVGSGACGNTNSSVNSEVRISVPYSLFANATELYFGEFEGRIRKIDLATGAGSMVLGSSQTLEEVMQGRSAGFNNITYLTNDGTDIYVTDLNSVIRKYNPIQKTVSHWAGVPGVQGANSGTLSTANFSYAGMVKVGTDWFVTNYFYNVVQRIDASGNVTTVAGSFNDAGSTDGIGTAAKFNRPWHIAAIGTDVFVADMGPVSGSNNFRIRRIQTANNYTVSTIAGSTAGFTDDTDEAGATSTGRFNNIRGMVAHGTSLYITDFSNHSIRRIDLSNMSIPKVSTVIGASGTASAAYLEGTGNAARLTSPVGLATDGSFLYFIDTGSNNCRIRKASLTTFETSFIAGSGSCGTINAIGTLARVTNDISHLTVFGGELYFTTPYFIRKVNLTTASVATVAGQTAPNGVLPDYNNCDSAVCAPHVYRFVPTNFTKLGNYIYATDANNHVIWKIASDGTRTLFAGTLGEAGETRGSLATARFHGPGGITTDGTHLYLAEVYGSIITKIDMNAETVTTLSGVSMSGGTVDGNSSTARYTNPNLILHYGGALYISQTDFVIRKLDLATETVSTWVGTGVAGDTDGQGTAASLQSLSGLALVGNSLYITEMTQGRIRKIDIATGTVATLFTKDTTLSTPARLGADEGNLYYFDSKAYAIVKYNIAAQTETTLAGGFSDRYYLEVNGGLDEARLFTSSAGVGVWEGQVYFGGASSIRVIR